MQAVTVCDGVSEGKSSTNGMRSLFLRGCLALTELNMPFPDLPSVDLFPACIAHSRDQTPRNKNLGPLTDAPQDGFLRHDSQRCTTVGAALPEVCDVVEN